MTLSQRSSSGVDVPSPFTLREVAALCAFPWGLEAYSPLGEHNYLLLSPEDTGVELQPIVARLRNLPCPVIAVTETIDKRLLHGVDVVVADEQDVVTLLRNIDTHPLAAMTLVQLLRHNEDSTPEQGLLAESLAYATLQGDQPRHTDMAPGAALETGDPVRVERSENELHVILNRPEERNAYSAAMRDALYDALLLLKSDESLERAIISGEGSCFSIGGDLREFGLAPHPATAHAIRSSRSVPGLLLALGDRLEFRLHRACIGAGIELPAFAARVLADRNTFVQLPELRLGLLPGAGGTVSIPRRIGRHRTAYLALSGRRINASTALEWGLIDGVL